MPTEKRWFIYIVRTARDHLYTGITTDPTRRFNEHSSGKGAKALRGAGPLIMEVAVEAGNRAEASRAEYAIKQLTRVKKEVLLKELQLLQNKNTSIEEVHNTIFLMNRTVHQ